MSVTKPQNSRGGQQGANQQNYAYGRHSPGFHDPFADADMDSMPSRM
jgi:hypothetical protein